jgi:hypothetical protein
VGFLSLSSSLIIKVYNYYYYYKNYYRERKNKIVESILRKPVYTTNNFSPLLVCLKNCLLAASFGSHYNLIQSLRLHTHTHTDIIYSSEM